MRRQQLLPQEPVVVVACFQLNAWKSVFIELRHDIAEYARLIVVLLLWSRILRQLTTIESQAVTESQKCLKRIHFSRDKLEITSSHMPVPYAMTRNYQNIWIQTELICNFAYQYMAWLGKNGLRNKTVSALTQRRYNTRHDPKMKLILCILS